MGESSGGWSAEATVLTMWDSCLDQSSHDRKKRKKIIKNVATKWTLQRVRKCSILELNEEMFHFILHAEKSIVGDQVADVESLVTSV